MRTALLIVSILLVQIVNADPLTTSITYQGELLESGVPADGIYDFEFRLFDVADGGTEIVSAVSVDNLQVTEGVFTTEIDFGASPFNGDQLWLQISVRPGGDAGGFTQLLPRQKLTAAPYALNAEMVSMDAITSSEILDDSIGSADVNSSQIQFRVVGTCPPGSSIQSINNLGNVTCETDDGIDLAGVLCPPEQVMVGFQEDGQPACTGASAVAGNCPISTSIELVNRGKVDFILLADNSGSMGDELAAMEAALNGMASTLSGLNSDYRFILLNDHGSGSFEMCVPPPLSGTVNCAGPAVSGARFFHYDVNVQSHDSLCIILDAFAGGEVDESGFFSNGYQTLLRHDAFKAFIELTDDGVTCTSSETGFSFADMDTVPAGQTAATDFDTALLGLSEQNFGSDSDRRYGFYGIIGVPVNGNATTPYLPTDSVTTSTCPNAVDPGTGYQWLSKGSEGLWFSQCETADYPAMLDQIAVAGNERGGMTSTCTISPSVPAGRTLDLASSNLVYTPGGMGMPVILNQVANGPACSANDYYFEMNGDLTLCPATCATIQADMDAGLQLDVDCEWPP